MTKPAFYVDLISHFDFIIFLESFFVLFIEHFICLAIFSDELDLQFRQILFLHVQCTGTYITRFVDH